MFCKNCGKELCEQAFVCPDCGCLTNNTPVQKPAVAKVQNSMDRTGILKLLTMISFGCFCAAFIFAFIALTDAYVWIGKSGAHLYFWVDYVVPTLILSVGSCGTALTAFIMSFKKGTGEAVKFMCILNFMLSVAILGVSIALLVMSW